MSSFTSLTGYYTRELASTVIAARASLKADFTDRVQLRLLPNQYGYIYDIITGDVYNVYNMELIGFKPNYIPTTQEFLALGQEPHVEVAEAVVMSSIRFFVEALSQKTDFFSQNVISINLSLRGPDQIPRHMLCTSFIVDANMEIPRIAVCTICTDVTAQSADVRVEVDFQGPHRAELLAAMHPYLIEGVSKVAGITPRELEIVNALAHGHSTKAIAENFAIAEGTVSKHRANLLAKLDVGNTAELVALAKQKSWVVSMD